MRDDWKELVEARSTWGRPIRSTPDVQTKSGLLCSILEFFSQAPACCVDAYLLRTSSEVSAMGPAAVPTTCVTVRAGRLESQVQLLYVEVL